MDDSAADAGRDEVAELIFRRIRPDPLTLWMMSSAEKLALFGLLELVRPDCAIELGTAGGGSLQVLAHFAKTVHSLDINEDTPARLGPKFTNVEFHTGDSRKTLPDLLARLQKEEARVGFVLIDGDHTSDGVKADIENLMKYRPICPVYVLMHDSFSPWVRAGLRQANWAGNQHVHSVELDFVPGSIIKRWNMWGGMALSVMRPEPRTTSLVISAVNEHLFRATQWHTIRHPVEFTRRIGRKIAHVLRKPT